MRGGEDHPWRVGVGEDGGVEFASALAPDATRNFCDQALYRLTTSGILFTGGGKFDHIVVSYDSIDGSATYFVNGKRTDDLDHVGYISGSSVPDLVIGGHRSSQTGDLISAWVGTIDDLAFWSRPLSEREAMLLWNGGRGRSLARLMDARDEDQDGMHDTWEDENGLQIGTDDSGDDPDGDGASNLTEFLADTDPGDADTDDDGLMDGVEDGGGVWINGSRRGTDPRRSDSDGDGLPDGAENPEGAHVDASQSASDPNKTDTDGDGHTDDAEAKFGSHPGDAGIVPAIGAALLTNWAFDGDYAEPVSGMSGTPEGEVTFEPGRFGQALWFDGNGSVQIDERSIEELDFVEESFSIGMWVKLAPRSLPNNGKWESPIAKGIGATWRIDRGDEGDVSFHPGWEYGIAPAWEGIRLNDDRFHHLVAVVDQARSLSHFYIDGSKLDAFSSPGIRQLAPVINGSEHPVVIGWNPDSSKNPFTGWIDDVAIWNRALTDEDIGGLYYAGLSVDEQANATDADGDGMNDGWERRMGLNPAIDDAAADSDGDGLRNTDEFSARTNPLIADTDGDGLVDGVETGTGAWVSANDTGTDVLEPDSDGDGLLDGDESPDTVFLPGTVPNRSDPNVADTDGDGFPDEEEFRLETDATLAEDFPELAQGLVAIWPLDGDARDDLGDYHGVADGDVGAQHVQVVEVDERWPAAALAVPLAVVGGR